MMIRIERPAARRGDHRRVRVRRHPAVHDAVRHLRVRPVPVRVPPDDQRRPRRGPVRRRPHRAAARMPGETGRRSPTRPTSSGESGGPGCSTATPYGTGHVRAWRTSITDGTRRRVRRAGRRPVRHPAEPRPRPASRPGRRRLPPADRRPSSRDVPAGRAQPDWDELGRAVHRYGADGVSEAN